ncbi:DNA end-binding protein Ku [Raineyella antarctica]|uniref:Non-homologous end joining protein Ku n=2 Tax=Raineyella antarctica TaxID=1577474 RepID=A0A1G6GST6_9ACTN|nr:DNA end-binding protein Ku [Raineyella antarctica]
MWSGAISFGLVNVPVKLYSASSSHDLPLHQVHDADGGRIRYQRRCEVCGEIVAYEHIDKSYEEDGKVVVLSDEELASLPAEASKEIQVLEFVPSDQIDPLMLGDAYYLEPDPKAAKPYALLRSTLEQAERTAVVKYALRQRTRLGVLRVRDDLMVLQSVMWPDELREPEFSGRADAKVTAAEQKMANALVEQLSEDFNPEGYVDDYQLQLHELVEAKLTSGETTEVAGPAAGEEPAAGGEVIDLMAALQASLDRKRGAARGAGSGEGSGKARKATTGTSAEPTQATRSRSAKAANKAEGDQEDGTGGTKQAGTPAKRRGKAG